ncbi:hypothetical protein NHX12_002440, partial [Muraenolepis orangiensis]
MRRGLPVPHCEVTPAVSHDQDAGSLSISSMFAICICVLAFLDMLMLGLFMYSRWRRHKGLEEGVYHVSTHHGEWEDLRENMLDYDEEGGGEQDQKSTSLSSSEASETCQSVSECMSPTVEQPDHGSDYECYSLNGEADGEGQADKSSTIPRHSNITQNIATICRTPSSKTGVRRTPSMSSPIPVKTPKVPHSPGFCSDAPPPAPCEAAKASPDTPWRWESSLIPVAQEDPLLSQP